MKIFADKVKYENLSKNILFSVKLFLAFQLMAHVDPKTYSGIYDLYKQKTSQNIYKKQDDYIINVKEDML